MRGGMPGRVPCKPAARFSRSPTPLNLRFKWGRVARIGHMPAAFACRWVVAAFVLAGSGMRMPSGPADVAVIVGNARSVSFRRMPCPMGLFS